MRAKPSSTASGMLSRSGPLTAPIPFRSSYEADFYRSHTESPEHVFPGTQAEGPASAEVRSPRTSKNVAEGEGLSHDARNLLGAIGLYCDLLSMPGVLQQAHRHYVEELRLLGKRSGALIERLLPRPVLCDASSDSGKMQLRTDGPGARTAGTRAEVHRLRAVIEGCAGVLNGIAGSHGVEIRFGPAASVPVPVAEESVERILVNLVTNSVAAMEAAGRREGPVRIEVGMVANRRDDPEPGVIRRVRLVVEDSGCGMDRAQLDRVLRPSRAGGEAPGGRGVGLHVVQDLVASSEGDLRIVSEPGAGTRVQMEWRVAPQGKTKEPPQAGSGRRRLAASGNLEPEDGGQGLRGIGSDFRGWIAC